MNKSIQKWGALLTAFMLCVTMVACTKDPEIESEVSEASVVETQETVFVTITAQDAIDADYEIPFASGTVLKNIAVVYTEGDTAYDVLVKACEEADLDLVAADSTYGKYIEGIGGLSAYDFGDESGWTYTINGEFAPVGVDAYMVQAEDILEWRYILSYDVFETEEADVSEAA